jgi:hypothetical protein
LAHLSWAKRSNGCKRRRGAARDARAADRGIAGASAIHKNLTNKKIPAFFPGLSRPPSIDLPLRRRHPVHPNANRALPAELHLTEKMTTEGWCTNEYRAMVIWALRALYGFVWFSTLARLAISAILPLFVPRVWKRSWLPSSSRALFLGLVPFPPLTPFRLIPFSLFRGA